MLEIHYATEGELDATVAARLITFCGAIPGLKRVAGGKSKLDPLLPKYIASAAMLPWLVIRDLDRDEDCAPSLVRKLAPQGASLLCLRIAVRQIEAWLLADREALSSYLRIPISRLPRNPENSLDAKRTVIDAARLSKSKGIRAGMVPSASSGASEGPEFSAMMGEFAQNYWRPAVARDLDEKSSLARAISRLEELAKTRPDFV